MTTLYYRLADNVLRAAATGSDVPKLAATLRSTFEFDVAFVTAAGLVAPLVAPEAGSVVVKAVIKLTPESDAILLDATVVSNGESGTARRYTAAWTAEECDSAPFRAAVLGKASVQATLEIEVTHADGTARAVTPVTLVNALFQPTDTAPDPSEDASWDWLKARLNAGHDISFDYDEEAKEITVNYDDTALIAALGGKANTSHTHAQSDVTDLVSDLAGKAAASHTHGIGDVTNLQAALDAKLALAGGTMTGALGITAGSLTTSPLAVTQTWNNAGVTCRGLEWAVTDTNSASDSTLLRLLGGAGGATELFGIDKAGKTRMGGSTTFGRYSGGDANAVGRIELVGTDTYGIQLSSSGGIWSLLGSITAGGGFGSPYYNGNITVSDNFVLRLADNNLSGGICMQMSEMTAPAAPATNSVRIYAEDNGSGKTRLMALFATGSAQQIAIEP